MGQKNKKRPGAKKIRNGGGTKKEWTQTVGGTQAGYVFAKEKIHTLRT